MLRVEDLWKIYGSAEAVKGISFAVETGEFFGLLGPNGAGKTSTIGMITGWVTPSRGRVEIGGVDLSGRAREAKKWVGLVPQNFAFYPRLTAEENLSFFGSLYGVQGGTLKERTARVLEMVSLTGRAGQRVETFSGGMKRRLNIAIGLIHDPAILILDEPTVGIDPTLYTAILDTVKELNRQGMTILYTTHYMEEAQELAHRVGIIDHGELIALGTQAELVRQVGEQQTLRLQFEEDQSVAALAEKFACLPGVARVKAEDHSLALLGESAERMLPPAVQLCGEVGLRLRTVQIQEPNLEALFLHLTGRALRD
uniref:ABC transporter ATP-binding protein n=1 Tax=Anaerolinea thermolimosa TaxID=229919 RepID=A0A7C4KI37_9CHLR